MSVVTNVMISFDTCEEGPEDDKFTLMGVINEWLNTKYHCCFGEDANAVCGGSKYLETPLYIAAFNYFDSEEFIKYVLSLPWAFPEDVQIFIQKQNDYKFTCHIHPSQ